DAVYGNDGLIHLPTIVSKDGWTVTKYFFLSDAAEHRGAMLIREAATQTVIEAGDATTLTCVLAEALVSRGMELIEAGANSQQLKKGMDSALKFVIEELKKISTPVRGNLERVRQIATVSANNDKAIGDLIAEAVGKIGYDGVISIEQSRGMETEVKVTDGVRVDRGWISPLFVNNPAKETCEFENPLILLYEKRVTHHKQILPAVEISFKSGRPLLIICEDAADEGLAFLAVNAAQKKANVCAIKSPEFGDKKREWMEDLALLTGATYVSDIRGVKIDEINISHFGGAKKTTVSKGQTVIVGGEGDQEEIQDMVNNLKMNLAQAKTEDDKLPIDTRIARLTGGIAVIHVGAATETELTEKMDRVDDSVRATRAAIAEGFVPGGGSAFVRLGLYRDGSELTDMDKGGQIVHSSLRSPFLQICENAGVDGRNILKEVMQSKQPNSGYNVLTDKIEDMVEAGIIDSTKALICALTNAVSVAGMILTSECSIITIS
ncbi:MAG: chaperonin GroEL, partial [Planktothrix sp.]